MGNSISLDHITLGVCYYPEHWPESLWKQDLERMKQCGIECVRIAEFAWSIFEPEEGQFTFGLFDRFLRAADEIGMKVIFGTPTATPPAWLTARYPEVLNARKDGVLYRHGMRRHYNYNSPVYREFCSRITEKLAEHYCGNRAVAGWQIDNELNCEINEFYSEADHLAFRRYLQKKYRSLDKLNEAWGTVFWNQTYSDWGQVRLARPAPGDSQNPHMELDEKRFFSESAISFCKMQSDIIRRFAPEGQFITTNGIFGNLDSHRMVRTALDFIMYDSYPNFAFAIGRQKDGTDDRKWSMHLAVARSISPNFGIMEQQSGPGGWSSGVVQPAPKPGQMRLWTFQSIANGADYISYFRWRTSIVGTEIYWHGLLDHDNLPNRRIEELKAISSDVSKLSQVAGSEYKAGVAVLRDYDNVWDGELDRWHGLLSGPSETGLFLAMQHAHTPYHYVYLDETVSPERLSSYRLLIAPHPVILTRETAELLEKYVRGGGTLVFGARTGYKDGHGRCRMLPVPGLAAELCGIQIRDFTFLRPEEHVSSDWGGQQVDMPVLNETIQVNDPQAEVAARYQNGDYAGEPAVTRRAVGNGSALYFAAGFNERNTTVLLQKLGVLEPYRDLFVLPAGCELAVREKEGGRYYFLLNYSSEGQNIRLNRPALDLLSGEKLTGDAVLPGYGVFVLKEL